MIGYTVPASNLLCPGGRKLFRGGGEAEKLLAFFGRDSASDVFILAPTLKMESATNEK
jgi:hypothetical protein